jgi:hypothetical protein
MRVCQGRLQNGCKPFTKKKKIDRRHSNVTFIASIFETHCLHLATFKEDNQK